jgi:hypothetical protein
MGTVQLIISIPHTVYHFLRELSFLSPGSNYFSDAKRGRFIEYLLDRPDVQKAWQAHTEHAFVAALADGTLPVEAFKYYLIQDYLYLVGSIVLRSLVLC